jgi:ribosomal subunit interface protein
MEISVIGKNLDVGESLRRHVEGALPGAVGKYFDRALDAVVTVGREAHRFRVDIAVHAGRGLNVQGRNEADDAYAAFDGALERIAKQLRRYKRRLRNHKGRVPEESVPALQYVIAAETGEGELPETGQPVVIAEMPTEIVALTVGEAVMHLDLADVPAVMFRNRAHGGLNVVYRRPDGNVGWIDPSGAARA